MNPLYTLHRGELPLLVSVPHAGTEIPPTLRDAYTEQALDVADTDWHLGTVYAFARELGASLLVPRLSRYVIDLNRPPDDRPMYAGANNTELCPTRAFTGEAIYRPGRAPDAGQVAARLQQYWQPYHDALQAELERLHARHGWAVLWDGHSIASRLPWLFEGRLPDLNLGTAGGASCAPALREAAARELAAQGAFSHVVDGRFKGGYITRHYGRPAQGVHALQMEMVFAAYLQAQAAPYALDTDKLPALQGLLRRLLLALLAWKPGDV